MTGVYTHILLSWKFLMYIAKKSQWAMKFVTEQPRLNLLCQALFHLASLQPVHKNPWERPLAHTLASSIYEDLQRLGGLLNFVPLKLALEHLQRKHFASLLRLTPPSTVDPIDRFIRIRHQLVAIDAQAVALIDATRTIGHHVPRLRTHPIMPENKHPTASSSSESREPPAGQLTAETAIDAQASAASQAADVESEFGDIEFEDVVDDLEDEMESTDAQKAAERPGTLLASAAPATDATGSTEATEVRHKAKRDLEVVSTKLKSLQKRLGDIGERRNWLPTQSHQFNLVVQRIDELLEILAHCSHVETEAILAAHSGPPQQGSVVIEFKY